MKPLSPRIATQHRAGLLHFGFYLMGDARRTAGMPRRPAFAATPFAMKKYMCLICGWIYDEAVGSPEDGLAPGTRWDDVPPNWTCPECGARKEDFEMIEL
jgi:rubredoxin